MNRSKRLQPDTNSQQPKGDIVSIAPSITARELTRQFVAHDAPACGGAQFAERALAKRLGVSPGTIRNLVYGRAKRVCLDFFARLKAEQLRRLSLSLSQAEHELFVARSIGLDPRSPEFRALEAAAEAARKVMEEV